MPSPGPFSRSMPTFWRALSSAMSTVRYHAEERVILIGSKTVVFS